MNATKYIYSSTVPKYNFEVFEFINYKSKTLDILYTIYINVNICIIY